MNKFDNLVAWAEARRDLWLDCIRIYLGLGLFVRGLVLAFHIHNEVFVNLLARSGQDWLLSGAVIHYVTIAHFAGGLMLALGLLTRIAALVQIPVLAVAVFVVHRQDGLFAMGQSLEFSALVLMLLVVTVIAGAGRFSLDHVIFGEHAHINQHPEVHAPAT
ncbi:MAG TPA: DoxX family membrane protein [Opitutaceae bacterium]|nr:DoxX family membrane protein [Opitutaceae bacterium]